MDRLTTTNASCAMAAVGKDLPFVMSCEVLAVSGGFGQIKNVYVGARYRGRGICRSRIGDRRPCCLTLLVLARRV
jgi:predicted GNAT family acetyltransferase